jgi:hypothetical protein
MSIVGVTQNGNTEWSGVKLLHFSLNDGTYEECDCGSDEKLVSREVRNLGAPKNELGYV